MPADGLRDGEPRVHDVDGTLVLLLRQGDRLHATDALCPHKFTALADGTFGDRCVTCPQHDATFDLRSGAPGDGEAWAGRLPVHEARIRDGTVEVRLRSAADTTGA